MNKIIIIAGATASGKTAFSVELAKKLNTQIISCDSMQIYKHMDIGTAKITTDEMDGITHHMVDIVLPNQPFSVGEYSQKATKIIDSLLNNNKIPIIVGGTGLYIDSILYNMSFGGEKDNKLREDLQKQLELHGKEYMHNLLKQIDPEDAQKIHPNNTKRVLRALEIYYSTGKSKSLMQTQEKKINYDCCLIVLNPPRDILYERINKRVDVMFEKGLENEVKKLIDNKLVDFDCQSMQAIGYKEFKDYFEGSISIDELKSKIKQNSRNYAKRQLTWFKRYDFAKWYDILESKNECMNYILNWIKGDNNEF